MKIIPPKHYIGLIPDGYRITEFIRFEVNDEICHGVLFSGERIECKLEEPTLTVKTEMKDFTFSAWLNNFFRGGV